jgi:hypothetical protein
VVTVSFVRGVSVLTVQLSMTGALFVGGGGAGVRSSWASTSELKPATYR